jgi:hypothetical protein
MASTFSPSLRVELIGDGDQSGIWGQTTNTNLGTLIEQAIAGVVTITMVDANYTMTNFNGVSDEARNQVIVLTGTNTAQRNLIAPLVEKTYTVKNSTTGGYAVQIIGSSGLGVVVPNGTTALVYCDGINFYAVVTGSTGNFTVNGDLTVVGNAFGQKGFDGTTVTAQGYGLRVRRASGGNATLQFTNEAGSTQLGVIQHDGSNLYITPSTGTVNAPTAANGTNTTQIATTAFVQNTAGGTMATQNANAVAITGGNVSVANLTSTGTTKLVTTGAAIRNVTIGSNEIAIAQPNNPVFLNLCDVDGNNGGGYSMQIRGLGSAGAAGINFTNFLVAANSATFNGTIAATGQITQNGGVPVAPRPSLSGSGSWVTIGAGNWNGSGWVLPGGGTWAWFISNRGGGQTGIDAGGAVVAGSLGSPSNNFGFAWQITG